MKNIIEFEEELILENSYTVTELGKFFNRMELFINEKSGNGYITWNYGKKSADEDEEQIGLWFNGKELEDYDGVFSLPKEAITLIKQNGYTLSEDLKECYPDEDDEFEKELKEVDDSGFFVEQWKLQDFDHSTENGIMTLDRPKDYPYFKYFVRVGGGWRGFKKKVNAKRYYKQD